MSSVVWGPRGLVRPEGAPLGHYPWFTGMQEQLRTVGGLGRLDGDGVEVLMLTMAARVWVTVRADEQTSVTIAAPPEGWVEPGLQHVEATADQAVALIQRAVAAWERGAVVLADPNVALRLPG